MVDVARYRELGPAVADAIPTRPQADARPSDAVATSAKPLAIALTLIALPTLLFLGSHLSVVPLALICLACALGALAFVERDLRPFANAADRGRLAACLALGFALCLLGGETHLFFANDDWLIRDAVLGDLVGQHWPVGYIYAGEANLLRAPLGMYLVPAVFGKVFGVKAAHAALLAQNGTLLGCVLHCFSAQARSRGEAAVFIAVFVLFSGWDIVGQALFGHSLAFATHLSRWGGILQFSATIVQIFWVPNHALSGWVFVAAYLEWRKGGIGAASLAVIFGFCVFWSPLSAIGALPFTGYALLRDAREGRLDLRGFAVLALAALALAPVLIYLGLDFGRVPHGGEPMSENFVILYAVFEALELLPFLLLLRFVRSRGDRRRRAELAIIVAVLLLVPFFRIGGNDFVMRASIPALALLALRIAALLRFEAVRTAPAGAIAVVATLAVGAVTPLYEVGRALTSPAYRISSCNMMTANRFPPFNAPLYHYLARVETEKGRAAVLARPASLLKRDDTVATCWPDHGGAGPHGGLP